MKAKILASFPRLGLAPVLLLSCQTAPEHTPAEGALGPYSAAVSRGDLVFLSGQIGQRRDGSFEEEAASALDKVAHELSRLGLELSDCVSATVFLTDMADYAAFNEVYARRLEPPYPARACVAVAALPADARVEVQVIAARSR